MTRTTAKNKYKARPHSQWITVPVQWKAFSEEDHTLVGYASVWGGPPDEHGDIITKGAFTKTIKERVSKGIVPLLDSHIYDSAHTLGTVYRAEEDDHGLKIWAKLSSAPTVEEIRQKMIEGHLGKLSIGYDSVRERYVRDDRTGKTARHLDELKLYEISVVPIPALERASILSVKTVVPFQDFPIADREREWDSDAAEQRVREAFGGGDNLNFSRYRRAFLWYDQENPELLGSYKLQIADWIDGRLFAVPRAIFSVAQALSGARGGINIPEADKERVRAQIERYYAKMSDEFDDDSIKITWEQETKSESVQTKDGLDTEELDDDELFQFYNSVRQMWFDFPQPANQAHFVGMGAAIVAEMMARDIQLENERDSFLQASLMFLENSHTGQMDEKFEEEKEPEFDMDDIGAVPEPTASHTLNSHKMRMRLKLLQAKLRLEGLNNA